MPRVAGVLGVAAAGLFALALVVFGSINPSFHPIDDYVSKLGAAGQPYALWWNIIGFGLVGVLSAGFGFAYGVVIQDRLVSVLLCIFGVGFAITGVPIELEDGQSALSKAHILAICLGLAGWMFALARMTQNPALGRFSRRSAQIAATLLLLPIAGLGIGLWSMPVTHRLVFIVVFGWQASTAIGLLRRRCEPFVTKSGAHAANS